MEKEVEYNINSRKVKFLISGNFITGGDFIMLKQDHNLIEKLSWNDIGYTIEEFKCSDFLNDLKEKIHAAIYSTVYKYTNKRMENPSNYHKYIDNEEQHLQIVNDIYHHNLNFDSLEVDKKVIEDRVSEILGVSVSTRNPHSQDKVLNEKRFQLRMVRPKIADNNPLHRDVYLDRLKHAVNLYLPLWGSNENSSLPIIPGSHLWPESEIERTDSGAIVNGSEYTVPAITWTKYGLNAIRPNPAENHIMLFSPYLIHGGGYNFNEDITRVSLELRFWASAI
ncbi:MAG: phytanoyl-CoA dioxygenase family protein [Legionellales bacterium]|nr:phytanoyl-CoA dioxygenase family protein [Legionellales bacterium]